MQEDYIKTKVLNESGSSKHYAAVGKDGEGCFLFSEFYERDAINMFITDFIYIAQNKIPEFVECFSENSVFYVVFKYTKGVPLLKFLEKEKLAFDYRLSIAKNIIFKLWEQGNVPICMQKTALTPENIVIEEGNIFFNYEMDLSGLKEAAERSVFYEADKLLSELFTYKEASGNDRLKLISDKCRKDVYESLGELLKDFDILSKEETETLNLKTVVEEKKKALIAKFRNVIVAVTLLIGIATSIYEFVVKGGKDVPIFAPVEEIGTLSFERSEEETVIPEKIISGGKKTVNVINKEPEPIEESAVEKPVDEKPSVEPEPEPEPIKEEEPLEPEQPEYISYFVKTNDNLYKICREHYGDLREVARVIEYNQLTNPNKIFAGQEIKLPTRK